MEAMVAQAHFLKEQSPRVAHRILSTTRFKRTLLPQDMA